MLRPTSRPSVPPTLVFLVAISLLFMKISATSGATSTCNNVEDLDGGGSCSSSWPQQQDSSALLKEMNYTIRGVQGTFLAYIEPNVATFYQKDPALWSMKRVEPSFDGVVGKFINLSRDRVRLFVKTPPVPSAIAYEPKDILLREIAPMSAQFFTCYPGQALYFTLTNTTTRILRSWTISSKTRRSKLMVYDPYFVKPEQVRHSEFSPKEHVNYNRFQQTFEFQQQYEQFTGRPYLPNTIRQPVSHHMWNADYFGQQHFVETKETHFVTLPSVYEYGPILEQGQQRILQDDEARLLEEYRTPYQSTMNMTLTVLSCAPRVFEIPDFLSPVEVEHILSLSNVLALKKSTMGSDSGFQDGQNARTSKHTRVKREQTQIMDSIYRRAADLLRIDEALLRARDVFEDHPNSIGTGSIAEAAQLVHYSEGQQYAAHQDWVSADIEKPQQANRFATLLLYLNEGMIGGETSFPRWVNAKTSEQLKVVPKVGKAILFYNLLPDGNMDELSIHAALPISQGEKWVINLWIWDPLLQ